MNAQELIDKLVEADAFQQYNNKVSRIAKRVGVSDADAKEIHDFFIYHEPRSFKAVNDWWTKEFLPKFDKSVAKKAPKDAPAKLWKAYVVYQKKDTGPSGPFRKYKAGVHY